MFASRRLAALLTVVLLATTACSPGSPPAPSATPIAAATATPIAILPGEPWLVYNWPGADGGWGLSLVRPDGTDAHAILTELPDEQRAPAWSPDGSKLAFVNRGSSDAESPDGAIWISNADGSDAKRSFDGGDDCQSVFHPSWSPDGTQLALVCYEDEKHATLATLDLTSRSLTPLATVTYPEFLDNPPRWSPDGTSIAFDVVRWDPTDTFLDGSLVATVPAAGGEVRRLTTFDTFMSHPDWRPDGTELVMNSYDLGNASGLDTPSNLYAIKPDGTGLRQLTHASVDGTMKIGQPRWDADGSRIIVAVMNFSPDHQNIESVRLAFVDAAGGEPVVISDAFDGKYPDIRPTP
jgi:Tol biopolymer transport system component